MKCPDCNSGARRMGSYVGANFPPFARTLYYRCKSKSCDRRFVVFERIVSPSAQRRASLRASGA